MPLPPPNTHHSIYLVGATFSSTAEKTSRQLQEDPDVLPAQVLLLVIEVQLSKV